MRRIAWARGFSGVARLPPDGGRLLGRASCTSAAPRERPGGPARSSAHTPHTPHPTPGSRRHGTIRETIPTMPSPLLSLFTGRFGGRRAVETIVPERTFADVTLPPATRRTLDQALAQVRSHSLIFGRWGLGERHATGLGLAFNFAGPPGTGKTICAEAIANALGKKLLLVNYAEVESMWAGETPKNVAALFRAAIDEDAVLFFDEADAIAARRTASVGMPHQREANTTVNVLLHEVEAFN